LAVVVALIGAVMVGLVGHQQAQYMVRTQPMKMAAAEALYNSEDPAGLSLLTVTRPGTQDLPWTSAFRDCSASCPIIGSAARSGASIRSRRSMRQYGAGNYVPIVPITYWSFRLMVGTGVSDDRPGGLGAAPGVAQAPLARLLPALGAVRRRVALPGQLRRLAADGTGRQPWVVVG